MPNIWRLICSAPASASFNMALDEALLLHTAQKMEPPTLRLYSWEVPSLSLGYSQSIRDVDSSKLAQHGWQLVRRPTGGKAILHTDELTYSITAPLDEPLVAGSLLESYQRISQGLQRTLQDLGVKTAADREYPDLTDASKANPVCFRTPSNYEITWNQKKIIGSAQARKSGGVLQHGSLPLFGDLTRITRVLTYPDETARSSAAVELLERATTLEGATGKIIPFEEAAKVLTQAFESVFGIQFDQKSPSSPEIELANKLTSTKYNDPEWNLRF